MLGLEPPVPPPAPSRPPDAGAPAAPPGAIAPLPIAPLPIAPLPIAPLPPPLAVPPMPTVPPLVAGVPPPWATESPPVPPRSPAPESRRRSRSSSCGGTQDTASKPVHVAQNTRMPTARRTARVSHERHGAANQGKSEETLEWSRPVDEPIAKGNACLQTYQRASCRSEVQIAPAQPRKRERNPWRCEGWPRDRSFGQSAARVSRTAGTRGGSPSGRATNYFGLLAVSAAFAPVLAKKGGAPCSTFCRSGAGSSRRVVRPCAASKAATWGLTNDPNALPD
jgi:hypothetical protein